MKRILCVLAALPGPALAHGGHPGHETGSLHPLVGTDHILAMATVGLLAATLLGALALALRK